MTFKIIRTAGDLKSVTFKHPDGRKVMVYRQPKLFIYEWGRFVQCAPYDDHFVFENPDHSKGAPSHLCSCGSLAVIVGANVYKDDASATDTGELMVCLEHAQYGKHLPMNWD